MPTYVSRDGVWYPAKEVVGLTNITNETKIVDGKEVSPGEPYIYKGPDRASEHELALAHGVDEDGKPKVTTFGMDFRQDPDLINRARQMGFTDKVDDKGNVTETAVMAYAKQFGYDAKKSEKQFKEKAAEIVKHQASERKPEPMIMGGGVDTSGKGGDLIGGFGQERERLAKELMK